MCVCVCLIESEGGKECEEIICSEANISRHVRHDLFVELDSNIINPIDKADKTINRNQTSKKIFDLVTRISLFFK